MLSSAIILIPIAGDKCFIILTEYDTLFNASVLDRKYPLMVNIDAVSLNGRCHDFILLHFMGTIYSYPAIYSLSLNILYTMSHVQGVIYTGGVYNITPKPCCFVLRKTCHLYEVY